MVEIDQVCVLNVQRKNGRETRQVIPLSDVKEYVDFHKAHGNVCSVAPLSFFRGVE